MKAFLSEIVDRILADSWPLDQTVWVFPSKRAGTFAKNYLRNKLQKTSFAPDFYSIEEFIETLSGLTPCDNETALCLLYECYLETSIKNKDSFANFVPWGTILLQDFNEIDRYAVQAQKLYHYLQDLQEVSHWALEEDKTELVQNYLSFWEQLPGIYEKFTAKMLQKEMGHQGLMYKKAAAHIKLYLENNPLKKIYFIGFNALNTCESNIIQEVLQHKRGHIYWDIDRYFLEKTVHEAGYFIRKHQKEWPYLKEKPLLEAIEGVSAHYQQNKKIYLYGVPKTVSQAHLMGNILSQFNKKTLERTAVVLGNESLLKPLLPCLPVQSPANITMGSPLSESTMAHFVRALYELQSSGEKEAWYYQHIVNVLQHPYAEILIDSHSSGGAQKLAQHLASANLSFASLSDLEKQLPAASSVITLLFKNAEEKATSFTAQLLNICELLKKKAVENKQITLESETLYFTEILEALSHQLEIYPFIDSIKGFWRLFTERLNKIKLPYSGEALSGLQLMGMLESRNLDFETLIVSDVNEGVLPGGKSHNSFIPLSLKKEFGLPTFKEKDAVYAYHFYRLLQRAQEVHLLYNTATDVLEGGEPSRFIHQLRTQKIPGVEVHDLSANPLVTPLKKELLQIDKTPDIVEAITQKGLRGYSPSALNSYIRNPIDFYKKYVLKIEDPNEVEEIIAYNTFGTIVHETLDHLYANYINKPLQASDFNEIRTQISEVLALKYEEFHSPLEGARGKNIIAHRVILKYIQDFVSYDQSIAEKEGLEILSLEKTYQCAISLNGIPQPILFKGTIDRVHKRNGYIEILDFKTGSVKATELKLKDWAEIPVEPKLSKVLQLLAYAMVYQTEHPQTEIKAGIYSFKHAKQGIIYFENTLATGNKMLINESTIAAFKEELSKLLSEIYHIETPFIEKEV